MTNTNTEKMTRVNALYYVLNNAEMPEDVRLVLEGIVAQLEKRAAAPSKPSKSQQENIQHKAHLLAALSAADAPMTIPDLCATVEGGLTPNKVSALMGQLVKEGKATRIQGKDRKVSYMMA